MRDLGKTKSFLKKAEGSKNWETYWNSVDKAVQEIGYDSEEERQNLEGAIVNRLKKRPR